MKKNIGSVDRQIRYLFGAIFLLLGLFAPLDPVWKVAVLIIAAVAFITAITGL